MRAARATREVHHVGRRLRGTVVAAIDVDAGAIERHEGGRQPSTLSGRGSNETVEFRHPRGVERIEGAPERVIMEMAGFHGRGDKARGGRMLKKGGTR